MTTPVTSWRLDETANETAHSGTVRNGVPELRPTSWYHNASETEEKIYGEAKETDKGEDLHFSLAAGVFELGRQRGQLHGGSRHTVLGQTIQFLGVIVL